MRPALLVVVAMVILGGMALVAPPAAGEDIELKSTFLTFFDKGGGYIEYTIHGSTAGHLRALIDDPQVSFPYGVMGDGDGKVDQHEGDRYMSNLDDILTKREIVLRGVKLDNVDVDEHRGLLGTEANSTEELYLHITFRCHIMYDTMDFNVSGIELIGVLYGTVDDVPQDITIDEKTFIVAAGLSSYQKLRKESGSLWNMRVPLAAVISYHGSYPVTDPPSVRMEYRHDSVLGSPLALMLLMFIFTILTIKLPKAVAKDGKKERVPFFHYGLWIVVVLIWLYYFFGGAAGGVWAAAIACVVVSYFLAHMIYVKDWLGLAEPTAGIDLGEAMSATDPTVKGVVDDGLVAMDKDTIDIITDPSPGPGPPDVVEGGEGDAGASGAVPAPQQAPPPQTPQPQPPVEPSAPPPADEGATRSVRCPGCNEVFHVREPEGPTLVECPGCGKKGKIG